MDRADAITRMEELQSEIQEHVDEARSICKEQGLSMGNLNAYVFEQIEEHVSNANPYNQSFGSIILELEKVCKKCNGAGVIMDDDDEDGEDEIICPECEGEC